MQRPLPDTALLGLLWGLAWQPNLWTEQLVVLVSRSLHGGMQYGGMQYEECSTGECSTGNAVRGNAVRWNAVRGNAGLIQTGFTSDPDQAHEGQPVTQPAQQVHHHQSSHIELRNRDSRGWSLQAQTVSVCLPTLAAGHAAQRPL